MTSFLPVRRWRVARIRRDFTIYSNVFLTNTAHLAPENINLTCEPISVHVRTKGSEVFVSFQAETRNDAMKYNKSENITWVIY